MVVFSIDREPDATLLDDRSSQQAIGFVSAQIVEASEAPHSRQHRRWPASHLVIADQRPTDAEVQGYSVLTCPHPMPGLAQQLTKAHRLAVAPSPSGVNVSTRYVGVTSPERVSGAVMPYGSTSDLPATVQEALPPEASELFLRVINRALKDSSDEQRAFRVAWGALRNAGWRPGDDGGWVRKGWQVSARLEKTERRDDGLLCFGWASVAVNDAGELVIDHQGDIIEPSELESAVYKYNETHRASTDHHSRSLDAELVESVYIDTEKRVAMGLEPEGRTGWWCGFRVHDGAIAKGVEDGTIKQFSIGGSFQSGEATDGGARKLRGLSVDEIAFCERGAGLGVDLTLTKDMSHTPPQDVADAARMGLELRSEFGRGGTEVGVARARDLSNRRNVSHETIARMRSYFARHGAQIDRKDSQWGNKQDPSARYIAWLLWGGDPGRRWAESVAQRHGTEKQEIEKMTLEEVLESMSDEARAVVEAALAEAAKDKAHADMEAHAEEHAEEAAEEAAEPTDEELMKSLPEGFAKRLEAERQERQAMAKQLAEIKEAQTVEHFRKSAERLSNLPMAAAELAKTLRACDRQLDQVTHQALTGMFDRIQKALGQTFEAAGTQAITSDDRAIDRLNAAARDIATRDGIGMAKAFEAACRQHPDLYREHRETEN